MKIKLGIIWRGHPAGTIIEVDKGVGDALLNHRVPPAGVEVDEQGNPKGKPPKAKGKKPGPSEVK